MSDNPGADKIEAYRAAYLACHSLPFARCIEYRNGWFVFYTLADDGRHMLNDRYRRADLERMTATLTARALAKTAMLAARTGGA